MYYTMTLLQLLGNTKFQLYYNVMGPSLYTWPIVDQKVVRWCVTALGTELLGGELFHQEVFGSEYPRLVCCVFIRVRTKKDFSSYGISKY